MSNDQNLRGWIGRNLMDSAGDKIGRIEEIYVDEETRKPEWLAVSMGSVGGHVSFVPLAGATAKGDSLCANWDKATVKEAPHAEADGQLSQQEEASLYSHYGLEYSEGRSPSGLPEGGAPQKGSSDDAMTRSEEELQVGKAQREVGKVRLRKWVETEHASVTIPVSHDEVRVEREAITEENRDKALSGPEIRESEHEVVLTEEQVVANTEVVPKERVRLEKDTVTEDQPVEAELRKERIAVDGDKAPKSS